MSKHTTYEKYYNECKKIYTAKKNAKYPLNSFTFIFSDDVNMDLPQNYSGIIGKIHDYCSDKISNNKDLFDPSHENITKMFNFYDSPEISVLGNHIGKYVEENIYGCHCIVEAILVYKNKLTDNVRSSWLWHYDDNINEQIKAMVYLNDVYEDTGAFEVILKDNVGKKIKTSRISPDTKTAQVYDKSRIPQKVIKSLLNEGFATKKILGKRGKICIFDPNCIHRATNPTSTTHDSRLCIVYNFRPYHKKLQDRVSKLFTRSWDNIGCIKKFDTICVSEFDYLLEKIKNAEITTEPFHHIEIFDFLSSYHLNEVLSDKQIHFSESKDLEQLREKLNKADWNIQPFPGCYNNWNEYKNNFEKKVVSSQPIGSKGITFRLSKYKNNTTRKLIAFMNSGQFHQALKDKFHIKKKTNIVSAIQKNLSGYEISPHPDVRQKSLTYLLNINTNNITNKFDNHTHLLKFKKNYDYVEKFWKNNEHVNRGWVPWHWCETIKYTNTNNTIILFKPSSSPPTLHAVKLNYNHLKDQRTQIYGNLMLSNPDSYKLINYKDIES